MSALHLGSPARRGSYDGILLSPKNPQLKSLAQRRCSAPSLVFSKALSKPWSSGRDSLGCPISIEQCPFVLGLTTESSELILHECVQLTHNMKTKERHLFLFSDMLIIAKLKVAIHNSGEHKCLTECVLMVASHQRTYSEESIRMEWCRADSTNGLWVKRKAMVIKDAQISNYASGTSFRLKNRVDLCDLWAVSCGEEEEEEDGARELHISPRESIILIWPSNVSIISFRSLDVKELWLDTLVWQIKEFRGTELTSVPSARVLMKVLTSCNASKTLSTSNMEAFESQAEGDFKRFQMLVPQYAEDGICHLIEGNKKRRKVLSWPFPLRRSSTLNSESSDALDGELKTTLFDQPLSIVCEEDSLPKPILDILTILCLKGPFVEGIFRKNANEKARKELKEELNSGTAVDLSSKPVHLLAVVFKDFLRSIPHMLLSSDLYQEWMEALAKHDIIDRIEEMKRVTDKLPRPNMLLLKNLVCVLHHISKQSGINKMDASNLAICIGPNLLNPDQKSSQPLEVQKQLNDKVKALVEFFIDNCFDIFGDDVSQLLCTSGEDLLEQASSTELSSIQQNDSAYDSTDPEAEARSSPPQNQQLLEQSNHCRCDQCSRGNLVGQMDPTCETSTGSCIGKMERRRSEPNLFLSQTDHNRGSTRQKLAKSHDDVTGGESSLDVAGEDLINGCEENSFRTCKYKNKKPNSLMVNTRLHSELSLPKTPSSCSLDSSCSNSDSSVFTSSPRVSPSSPKRQFFPRHESFSTKNCLEASKMLPLNRQIKKHSMSFSFLHHKKILTKTQSWEPDKCNTLSNRSSLKKNFENGAQHKCNIVQESSGKEMEPAEPCPPRARLMSADEVFRLVDQRNPGKPPSYEEAIQRSMSAKLPSYRSLTVQTLRSTVLNSHSLLSHPLHDDNVKHSTHGVDASSIPGRPCMQNATYSPYVVSDGTEVTQPHASSNMRAPVPQTRTMSESWQQNKQECFLRRCSQPLFEGYEQIQYAKESYV